MWMKLYVFIKVLLLRHNGDSYFDDLLQILKKRKEKKEYYLRDSYVSVSWHKISELY